MNKTFIVYKHTCICECCRGVKKTAGGYIWRCADD